MCNDPTLQVHHLLILSRFSRYAPMIATPPFFMRNLVTFRKNDVFADCRLTAFSAHVWNYCDSAPRNWFSLLIYDVEELPLVPECTTASTAISTDPSCQWLPVVDVGFHDAPIGSIISQPDLQALSDWNAPVEPEKAHWRTIPSEGNGMIWKAVRHSFLTELLMWIVVLVFAGLVGGFGFHFSIPSVAYNLTMLVVFVWIYRFVSRRL